MAAACGDAVPAGRVPVLRRTAELLTGSPSPDDEPFEVTRAKASM